MMSPILDEALVSAVDELGYSYVIDQEHDLGRVRVAGRGPFEMRIRTNDTFAYVILCVEYPTRIPLYQRRAVSRLLKSEADRVYRIRFAMDVGMVRASLRVNLDDTTRPDLRVNHALKRFRNAVKRKFAAIATAVSPRRSPCANHSGVRLRLARARTLVSEPCKTEDASQED